MNPDVKHGRGRAMEVQTYDHLITEFQFWVCEVVLHHLIMDVPGRSQEGCF